MMRRLQLLLIAAILLIAAFSTGLEFLFYLVYLAILVIGGSYIVTRLGLSDLEAGYAVSQLNGHVGDRIRVTYTLRNTSRVPKPWLEIHNPTTLPGRPARPGDLARAAGRAVVARPGAAHPARPLPDRAAPDPDRRPVRLLRGVGDRSARGSRSSSTRGSSGSRCGACRRRTSRGAKPSPSGRSRRRRSRRPSGRGRRATASTGSTGGRPPATARSRSRSSSSSRPPTPGSSSTSSARSRPGAATNRPSRSAVRVAASVADKAILENRAVGMTVNAHRTADPAGRPRQPPAPQDHAAPRRRRRRRLDAARRDARRDRRSHPPGHDGDPHHRLDRSHLDPADRCAPDPRDRHGRRDARCCRVRSGRPDGRASGPARSLAPLDPAAEEQRAQRARALRHALSEYEIKVHNGRCRARRSARRSSDDPAGPPDPLSRGYRSLPRRAGSRLGLVGVMACLMAAGRSTTPAGSSAAAELTDFLPWAALLGVAAGFIGSEDRLEPLARPPRRGDRSRR